MIRIYNFIFILWKFLQNIKIAAKCFEISGRGEMPQIPLWLRAWCK